jgi:hypothetical protein
VAQGAAPVTVLLVLLLAAAPAAEQRIRVEFTADGRCRVTSRGPASRADIDYARRTTDFRCAIVGPPRGEGVTLDVVLPAGVTPSDSGAFPRLAWSRADDRWTGSARLPGAPAFVRVPRDSERGAAFARLLDALALAVTAVALAWSLAYGRRSPRS